jgi:hypothetical protein
MTKKTSVYRSFFIHPATWAILAILTRSISLLIQGVDPLAFQQAAAPLLIIQTLFTMMAGVMVTSIGAYLIYRIKRYGWSDLRPSVNTETLSENPNVVLKYISETMDWTKSYPWAKPLFLVVTILSISITLFLTMGYFTDGFGLFPDSFSFMGPVFDYLISGLLASTKAVAALPGLEFLGLVSDATMMMTAQGVSIGMFILASFLVPITINRVLNTLLGGGEEDTGQGLAEKESKKLDNWDLGIGHVPSPLPLVRKEVGHVLSPLPSPPARGQALGEGKDKGYNASALSTK